MSKNAVTKGNRKKFMGVQTVAVQERLLVARYSKKSGYQVIAQTSVALALKKGGPTITYSWLSKFGRNEIKNPGYDRMERLIEILDILAKPEVLTAPTTPEHDRRKDDK